MSRFLNAKVILSSVALYSFAAYADNENPYYTVEGTTPVVIPVNPDFSTTYSADFETLSGVKSIQLLNIKPSAQLLAQNQENRVSIGAEAEYDYSRGIVPFSQSRGAVDLRMSNVPVLDQGQYGTCVTFASTAALDARFNLGNYIDQQCSLALNRGLGYNWWNGAYTPADIIVPLAKYGLVAKGGCFGWTYPSPSQVVLPYQYVFISNRNYSSLIKTSYARTVSTSLDSVKGALKSGHRVLIGTFLLANSDPISVVGFDVTVSGVKSRGGLWACKQPSSSTNYCPTQSNAGHEIIITGYDDNQQLLKIRNSWNTGVGDRGDFYMTYAFFKSMVMDYTVVL